MFAPYRRDEKGDFTGRGGARWLARNNEQVPPQPSRRTFLTGAGAAALASLTAACASDDLASEPTPVSDAEVAAPSGTAVATATATPDSAASHEHDAVPFRADHQLGVIQQPTAAGIAAAFDVSVDSADALVETMQDLSAEIERMMGDDGPVASEGFLPPVDSGLIDASTPVTGLAITVAVGASLFDDRFGLADRRPNELIQMPTFFNDRLVRPELSHGDLVVMIAGHSQQSTTYALQQLVRVSDRRLQLRWVQEGYNELIPPAPDRIAHTRNLMGFRDGTSNLDTTDAAEMDTHVWVGDGDREPAWAVGGTYLAVRTIRMLIEFWGTAALVRQEQIFGRHRETGAPLGQTSETDEPVFAADRTDEGVPRRSHMRLANPRTPGTARILRRGFSYLNGLDSSSGTLDQGLLFLAYQRSLSKGFLEVQSRLEGEPLEDYIKPVGGGLFYVLPGPGADGWLGQSLLT